MRILLLCFAALWLGLIVGCSPKQVGSRVGSKNTDATPRGDVPPSLRKEGPGAPAPAGPSTLNGIKGVNPELNASEVGAGKATSAVKPGEEWRPVKDMAPTVAARKIDERLASLSGVKVQLHYEMKTSAGSGFGDPTLKIKSPKVFSFAYPSLKNGVLLGALAKADGHRVVQKIGPDVSRRDLNQKPTKRAPAQVEQAWIENPGREVLAGFLEGRTPFADLAASLPKQGYVLAMEKRVLQDMPNHVQYMLKADRAGTGKAGKSKIEIIMDGHLFLPMSFLVQASQPNSVTESIFVWKAGWLNKQNFDAKEFDTSVLSG